MVIYPTVHVCKLLLYINAKKRDEKFDARIECKMWCKRACEIYLPEMITFLSTIPLEVLLSAKFESR